VSLPYFPLYPTDFEADTAHLSIVEDGAFNRLLRLCWMTPGCSVPNDEAWILRRLRARSEDEIAAVRVVISEFFKVENGRLFSPRLRREALLAETAHQRRVAAGRKGGGAAKTAQTNEKESSNAKAMPKQPEPYITLDTDVSNATTPEIDPTKAMFDGGIRLLSGAGLSASKSRAILGKWRRDFGAEAVIVALGKAQREGAIDPVAFCTGIFKNQRQHVSPDGRVMAGAFGLIPERN
jgi:uncharacterized protein YdaU (DUF1376 family)